MLRKRLSVSTSLRKGKNAGEQRGEKKKAVWETTVWTPRSEKEGQEVLQAEQRFSSSLWKRPRWRWSFPAAHRWVHAGADSYPAALGGPRLEQLGISWRNSGWWRAHAGTREKCGEEGAAERSCSGEAWREVEESGVKLSLGKRMGRGCFNFVFVITQIHFNWQ